MTSNWKFTRPFWTANIVELFERAAYYGMFIVITLYLSREVGYNDIWAAWIAGGFSAGLYFFPPFSGAYADKIGFRKALIIAFSLLTAGYFGLGALPYKSTVIPSMILIMIGGSFIKSVITGTVAKETSKSNRARGFSIFYAMVNIGSFSGKTLVYPIRLELGLVYVNYLSAAFTLLALITVFLFYKSQVTEGVGKSMKEVWQGLVRLLKRPRLLALILITSGFWIVQHQLYATMPKYVIRLVGESAAPSWYANVNPLVVVLTVMFVTQMMKNRSALTSMTIGMFIMPVSAIAMASGRMFDMNGSDFGFFGMHPVAFMMIIGIIFQGLAETFISPRFLEYFSLQAPKGEEGMYLGFSHLHSFFSALLGFGISGYLLERFCPDPATLSEVEKLTAYDHAHYIWYVFAGIVSVAAVALIIYGIVTRYIDREKAV
ncbi:MAG: MFS transporter [Bacteroidales bacterium]|nr:MFS transporter [Bacteroidales bacterium]